MAIFIYRLRTVLLFCLSIAGSCSALFCTAFEGKSRVSLTASEYEFMDENYISILLPYENSVSEIIESSVEADEENIDSEPISEEVEDVVDPPVPAKDTSKPKPENISGEVSLKIMVWPVVLDDELKILELIEKDLLVHLTNNKAKPDLVVLKFDKVLDCSSSFPRIYSIFSIIWSHFHLDTPVPALSEIKKHVRITQEFLILSVRPLLYISNRDGYAGVGCLGANGKPFAFFPYFAVLPKNEKMAVLLLNQREVDPAGCTSCLWKECLSRVRDTIDDLSDKGFSVVIITTNFYHPFVARDTARLLKARYLIPTNTETYDFMPASNRLAREKIAVSSEITSYQPVQSQNLFIHKKNGEIRTLRYSHRVLPLSSPVVIDDPVETLPFYWSSLFSSYWGQDLYDYSPFYPSYFVIRLLEKEQ